ncbi:MAG TPA: LuxR C-terminal-related transcriptional regulator [Bryobacteraceae bacterium]|nr:LuxR C-terminal-related transcriptional regulator [Bryobacteraceae bacterium]
MRFTESVLAYKRPRVLIIAGAMIAVIALLDWKVATEVSFGFLYFFPVFLVASCYGQWQIAVVAAICTFLREGLGHFDPTYRFSRLFLAWGSFTAAGWLVRGVLANFQKVRDQLVEIQARDRLLQDSEEQLKVLIETSSAAILTLNQSGEVIQANDAASRLLGMEKDALLKQDIGEYLPPLAQVPSDQSAPIFRTTMECRGRRKNGEEFVANVCFSTYTFSGKPRLTAVITESEPSGNELPEAQAEAAVVLTNLEHTVLRGIFEGQTNKEIAGGLETSESAVKSTIQRLFTKLGARTRSQLVRIAIERLGKQFHVGPGAKPSAADQKILSP